MKQKTKRELLQDQLTQQYKGVGGVPVLSADMKECKIFDYTLKVGEMEYYKACAAFAIGIGKIERFMYAGYRGAEKDSVWFLVTEAQDGQKEWVSVKIWAQQKQAGLFDKEVKPVIHEQPKAVRPTLF